MRRIVTDMQFPISQTLPLLSSLRDLLLLNRQNRQLHQGLH